MPYHACLACGSSVAWGSVSCTSCQCLQEPEEWLREVLRTGFVDGHAGDGEVLRPSAAPAAGPAPAADEPEAAARDVVLRVTCISSSEGTHTHDLPFETPCEFDDLISSVRNVAPLTEYPELHLGGQLLPASGSALKGRKGWRFSRAWSNDLPLILCECGGETEAGPEDVCYTYSNLLEREHSADVLYVDAIAKCGLGEDVHDDEVDDASSAVEVAPVAAAPTEDSPTPQAPRLATAWWHRTRRPPGRGAIPPASRFFPLQLKKRDALRLRPGQWLASSCIEIGLQLIQQRL
jgi:hypothetical protein